MKKTTKKKRYIRNIRKKGKRTRRYKKHTRRYKKRTRRYKKKGGVFTRRATAPTAGSNPEFKGVSSYSPTSMSQKKKYNITSKIHPPTIVYPKDYIDYNRVAREECKKNCYLNNKFCEEVNFKNDPTTTTCSDKCFLGFKEEKGKCVHLPPKKNILKITQGPMLPYSGWRKKKKEKWTEEQARRAAAAQVNQPPVGDEAAKKAYEAAIEEHAKLMQEFKKEEEENESA